MVARIRKAVVVGAGLLGLLTVACTETSRPVAPTPPDATVGDLTTASGAAAASRKDAIADVQFGRTNTGTAFPPAEHDRSFHSRDKVVPRTVVLPVGGTVRFTFGVFHQAAVYDRGTEPEDITISPATLDDIAVPFPPFTFPDFLINDAIRRLALSPLVFTPGTQWTAPNVFDEPGRYLVICTVLPHFVGSKMYMWVEVK